MVEKMKNLAKQCFEGELTMPKAMLWFVGVVCMLVGIIYGLLMAPLTHGVTIGCNNGNHQSGCACGCEDDEEDEE